MVRSSTVLKSSVDNLPVAPAQIYLVHARIDKMPFEEFRQRRAEMFSKCRNRNRAREFFNRQSDDYKFCILTLVNRHNPGKFSIGEVGEDFESFDLHRRELIIQAMNLINRWGELLPGKFKLSDSII